MKRVRKSLERKWSTPGDVNIAADLVMPETPVCFFTVFILIVIVVI